MEGAEPDFHDDDNEEIGEMEAGLAARSSRLDRGRVADHEEASLPEGPDGHRLQFSSSSRAKRGQCALAAAASAGSLGAASAAEARSPREVDPKALGQPGERR